MSGPIRTAALIIGTELVFAGAFLFGGHGLTGEASAAPDCRTTGSHFCAPGNAQGADPGMYLGGVLVVDLTYCPIDGRWSLQWHPCGR